METKSLLVIEDDQRITQIIADVFAGSSYHITFAADGSEGLRRFYSVRPDLIILDIMLPDIDGWQICRRIREFSDVPIIIMTALDQDEEIVKGLELGALEYVTKPFSPAVLRARVRAIFRHQASDRKGSLASETPAGYRDGHLTVDLTARRILINGAPIHLSPTEYELLAVLVRNVGRVCTFNQIIDAVWTDPGGGSVNSVHVHISNLRHKLEGNPKEPVYLITEYGVGYRFEDQRGRSTM